MPQHLITVDPDPPVRGSNARVCYNFDAVASDQVTLTVTFDPGGSQEVTVTRAKRCATISVPSEAEVYVIEDESGNSYDKGGPVVAP